MSLFSTCGRGKEVKKISCSPYRNAPEHIFPGKVQEDVKLLPEALMEPYESEDTCWDSFSSLLRKQRQVGNRPLPHLLHRFAVQSHWLKRQTKPESSRWRSTEKHLPGQAASCRLMGMCVCVCVTRVGFPTQEDGWCVGRGECRFPRTLASERDASVVNGHVRGQATESGFAGEILQVAHFENRKRALPVVTSR